MTGSVFISYSKDPEAVATLTTSLRRHGLRPWHYAESLLIGAPTREDIESELAKCRAAILWLSKGSLASDYVTKVELPAVFRHQVERGLRILPVFVDWPFGEEAEEAVRAACGHEIGNHNGFKWDRDLPAPPQARAIAALYARTLVADLASEESWRPSIRCVTRTNAASGLDSASVNLDWVPEYPSDGSLPADEVALDLSRALQALGDAVLGSGRPGPLDVYARCHLHVGVALGHAFRRTTGMNPRLNVAGDWWSVEATAAEGSILDLARTDTSGPVTATSVSIEVSITQDVRPGVTQTIANTGAPYRRRTHLRPVKGPGQQSLDTQLQMNAWAEQVAEAVRTTTQEPGIVEVDLYLACPLQMAIAIGWRLNAAGVVRLHQWVGNTGPYQWVWTLPTS